MSSNATTEAEIQAAGDLLLMLYNTNMQSYIQHQLLGVLIATLVMGWCLRQGVEYFTDKNVPDRWYIKAFIGFILVILIGQVAYEAYNVWRLIDHSPGKLAVWFKQDAFFSSLSMLLVGTVLAPTTFLFAGSRVWYLYGRPKVAAAVGLFMIASLACSAAVAVAWAHTLPVDPMHPVPVNDWAKKFSDRLMIFFVLDVVVNFGFTILMLFKFQKYFQEESAHAGVVIQLSRMVLESQLPGLAGSVALLYFTITQTGWGTWYKTLIHIQPSLYVLACLTSVTSRRSIQDELLSNNLTITVSEAVLSPTPVWSPRPPSEAVFRSPRMTSTDTSASGKDDFFQCLSDGPEPIPRRSRVDSLKIAFGIASVSLVDEEKRGSESS